MKTHFHLLFLLGNVEKISCPSLCPFMSKEQFSIEKKADKF